jgi:hypothetical protein
MERLEPSWVTAASTESRVPSANLSTACPACQTPPTARGVQESARRGAVSTEVVLVLGIGCEAVTQGRNCPASPDPGAELKVSEVAPFLHHQLEEPAHPRLRRDPPPSTRRPRCTPGMERESRVMAAPRPSSAHNWSGKPCTRTDGSITCTLVVRACGMLSGNAVLVTSPTGRPRKRYTSNTSDGRRPEMRVGRMV